MKRFKSLLVIILIIVIVPLNCFQYGYAGDIFSIDCTEKEAYNRGYDYFKVWYIVNNGNAEDLLVKIDQIEKATVNKNRYGMSGVNFRSEMAYWRTLTFNINDTLLHSVQEKANCEAMLFNLLYDQNSETLAVSPLAGTLVDTTGNIVTGAKALNDILKQTSVREWSKFVKLLDEMDNKSLYMDFDLLSDPEKFAEFNNYANQFSDFSKGLSYTAKAFKIIDNCTTAAEYFSNVTKIGVIAGSNYSISSILEDMVDFTNNDAYKSALTGFSNYLKPYYTDLAPSMYTSSFVAQNFMKDVAGAAFTAILKALPGYGGSGAAAGAALGKFGGEYLTGEDSKFKKFNELEVYYDFSELLRNQLGRYIDQINSGAYTQETLDKFNAGYAILKNMYNIEIDCFQEYKEILYKEGVLNSIFPGVNGEKYSDMLYNTEYTRNCVNELFEADELNAKEAYEKAVKKYDPDLESADIIQAPEVQEREEQNRTDCESLAPTFGITVNRDKTLTQSSDVYGSMTVEKGTLNLNGHVLDIYGDLFVNGGTITGEGTINVHGGLIQKGGEIDLIGSGKLIVGSSADGSETLGNYYQEEGALNISGGKLLVYGDHIVGYEGVNHYDITYTITNSGEADIRGDFIAYDLSENSGSNYRNYFKSGRMSVGGDAKVLSSRKLLGYDGFTLILKGSEDLTLQNIGGGNVVIENPSERSITLKGMIYTNTFGGGSMTVTPDDLHFGGKLESDVTFDGDFTIDNDAALNGQKLTVNGNLTQYSSSFHTITADGDLDVKGDLIQNDSFDGQYSLIKVSSQGSVSVHNNYLQKKGRISMYGGTLTVAKDYIIGTEETTNGLLGCDFNENARIDVGGDFTAYYLYESSYSSRNNYFYSGNMTVAGNARVLSGYPLYGNKDFKLTLTGNDDLILQNIAWASIVIENASDRSITFKNIISPASLTGGDMTVKGEDLRFCGKTDVDLSVTGDIELYRDTDLNGHTLNVSGDVLQSFGILTLNGGSLNTDGNYYIAALSNGEYVEAQNSTHLVMNKSSDKVSVGKNMLVNTRSSSVLSNGTLSIKGNFTQIGTNNPSNFNATDNHLTILNGNKMQKITFGTYPSSKFNKLELHQFLENYKFSPETCWNELTIYCEHLNTELRNAVEKTCTEDGYSGDLYCLDCGELIEKGTVLEAEGHKSVTEPEVVPTCTEDGHKAGRICSECGTVLQGHEVIPAIGHAFGEYVVTKEPTCTDDGLKTSTCANCGEEQTEPIPAIGHAFEADQEYCLNGCGTVNPDYVAPPVELKEQSITVKTKSYTKVYGASAFSLGAEAMTPMTYKSSNTKVATVSSAGKVTIKGVGKATITINAAADETYMAADAVKVTVKVNPKGTTISKVTAASKGFKVTWKKQATQTTGYQIRYSLKSSMANSTTVTISKTTTVSKKVTKLKAKKKYYVQVRTYKTVSGTKYYSKWSAKKSTTTKA